MPFLPCSEQTISALNSTRSSSSSVDGQGLLSDTVMSDSVELTLLSGSLNSSDKCLPLSATVSVTALNVTLLLSLAEEDFAGSSAKYKQCSLTVTADISSHCNSYSYSYRVHSSTELFSEESCSVIGLSEKVGFQLWSKLTTPELRLKTQADN